MLTLTHMNHREYTQEERLSALLSKGWAQLNNSESEVAKTGREAEHLARIQGDNSAWAQSLFLWGVGSLVMDSNHASIELLSKALAVFRFLDDERGQWNCLIAIARAWRKLGDLEQALETEAQANTFENKDIYRSSSEWLHFIG